MSHLQEVSTYAPPHSEITLRPGINRPSGKAIRNSIHSALNYLSHHIDSSGRFDYEYDLGTGKISRKYNMLRHAGTSMVLYRLAGSQFDDGTASSLASIATSYLRRFITPTEWNGKSCLALAENGIAKLGGTALALLALAEGLKHSVEPEADILIITRLAHYIVSQERDEGGFVSKRDLWGGPEFAFESSYYPGQAVLALCTAYNVTRAPIFLDHAERAMHYLAENHMADPPTMEGFTDHWAMIALAELSNIKAKRWYATHLRYLANPLLINENETNPTWLDRESTTQVSTRVEGLIACLEIDLRLNDRAHALLVLRTILGGLARCYQKQVGRQEGRFQVNPAAYGGFLRSSTEPIIRIDYVQHALAASFGLLDVIGKFGKRGKLYSKLSQ